MSQHPKPRGKKQPPLLLPSQRATQTADSGGQSARAKGSAAQPDSLGGDSADAIPSPQAMQLAGGQHNLPLGRGVRLIAHHPCGLYVLDKPEGILSHPNKKTEIDRSLLTAPYSLAQECFYNLHTRGNALHTPSNSSSNLHAESNACDPDPPAADDSDTPKTAAQNGNGHLQKTEKIPEKTPEKLYLLHRLDSATSGLLLLADNEALANAVRAAFAADTVGKTYLALCAAQTATRPGDRGRWSERLERRHSGSGGGVVHVRTSGSGLSAATDYACLKSAARNSAIMLLELRPQSGRTHQLRVHCAQHGLPILGDAKYGDFRLNRALAKETGHKRLFLHATALDLQCTHQGKPLRLRFISPPPPEFDALLRDAPEGICPATAPAHSGTQSSRSTRPATSRNRTGRQQRPRKRG